MQQGRNNLQRELNERTGQLKALVKENFDHFISCKTTIDDIHKRLREAEKGLESGNSSYVSTHDVIETVSEVGCWALRHLPTVMANLPLVKAYTDITSGWRRPSRHTHQAAQSHMLSSALNGAVLTVLPESIRGQRR